jgi:hypothetical protein
LACKAVIRSSKSGRLCKLARQASFKKKGQQANPVLTLLSSHSKAVSSLPVRARVQDNLNPVGRVYYSFSTLLCTPCSRSQKVGMCLGAQAGEKQMKKVVTSAGFSRFRRATQTPFNLVYEARP